MNVRISGQGLSVTPRLKKLVNHKLAAPIERLLGNFSTDLKSAAVRIKKLKYRRYIVNFDMVLPGKRRIFAQNIKTSLTSSVLGLQHQIEKQIKRYKSSLIHRRTDRTRRPSHT